MNLTDYPVKIEQQKRLILDRRYVVELFQDSLAVIEDVIKHQIWTDKDLKNETVRGVELRDRKRLSEEWVKASDSLKEAKGMLANSEIALDRLQNDFAVAKIEARGWIADKLSKAEG